MKAIKSIAAQARLVAEEVLDLAGGDIRAALDALEDGEFLASMGWDDIDVVDGAYAIVEAAR